MTLNKSSPKLPPGCVLRPACATDAGAIRELMSAELLDPTQLHWSQFWVIECNERQVACGQLRRYPGAEEQVRLVVATRWRTRGLGTCLAKHLIQQATKPLYLACGARVVPFYTQLGFVPIPWLALPCPLKLKFGFSKLATTLLLRHLVFMQYLPGVERSPPIGLESF